MNRQDYITDVLATISQKPLGLVQEEDRISFSLTGYGRVTLSNGFVDQFRQDIRHGLNDLGFWLSGYLAERRRQRKGVSALEVFV